MREAIALAKAHPTEQLRRELTQLERVEDMRTAPPRKLERRRNQIRRRDHWLEGVGGGEGKGIGRWRWAERWGGGMGLGV